LATAAASTAIRAATDRVCPRPDAGQGLRRAARETATATSRRPPVDFGRLTQIHRFRLFCSTESSATPSASGSLKSVASGTQLRALNSPAVDRTQIDLVLIAHKKCVRTTVYYNIFGRKPTLRRLRAEDCDYESLIRIAIDFLTAHLQAWR